MPDGHPFTSCLIFAVEAEGHDLTTIEGRGQPAHLAPIQQAFLETAASQCGFCIPGMLLSAHALLSAETQPNEARIRQALSGNLCRCTGYDRIVKAVKLAANLRYGHP